MKKILSILFISVLIFSMTGCGGKTHEEFSEFQWPKTAVAELISMPESNIGHIVWDNGDGFKVYVAQITKSDYEAYIEDCWNKGFTIDFYRSDSAFWADNEDGYQVMLSYDDDDDVMSITMSSPRSPSETSSNSLASELVTEERPSSEGISEPAGTPSQSEQTSDFLTEPLETENISVETPSQSEQTPDILTAPVETEPSVEETPTEKLNTLYYSTNTLEQAKKGNSGVFSYKRKGTNYDFYWIIDFDEGCAYWFTYGNGNESCDRVQIDEGDLNSFITVTYHDGDSTWQYGLCFKRVRQPDRLIQSELDGTQYEFTATDLNDALKIRDGMEIVDY